MLYIFTVTCLLCYLVMFVFCFASLWSNKYQQLFIIFPKCFLTISRNFAVMLSATEEQYGGL